MGKPGRGLTHRTISGLIWSAWGKGGRAALVLLSLVVLARLLSPREFGTVSAALVVIEFSSILSRLGLGPAVVQRQELEPRHLQAAFTGSLVIGVLMGAAIWMLAPVAAVFFRNPQVEPVLQVLAWIFPLKGISTVAESLMLRELRFRWLANLDVAVFGLGNVLVAIVLALAGWGVWALVTATIVESLARSVILLYLRRPSLDLLPEWRALKEMLYLGSGFTLAKVANSFALQGDNLVVGHWLGPNALGLYGRAYNLMSAPASAIGKVLDDVLFPTMARVQDDIIRLGKAYRRGVAVIALVTLPLSTVLVVIAPELIRVVLGPRWLDAILPFRVLAAGTLFRTSYKMSDSLSRSTGVVYRRARRQVVYAGMVIGGAYLGGHWGITGVAAGVFVALTVNFLLMAQLSLEVCQMSWSTFWAAHGPSVLLAAAAGSVAWSVATGLRQLPAPPLVILMMSAGGAIASVVWLMSRFPQRCLGEEGLWTLDALTSFAAKTPWRSRGVSPAGVGE
jgi:O-antigen/teichoic acid export membrane protein